MRQVAYFQNHSSDIARIMIYESDIEVYVFGFDDLSDGPSMCDYLFQDLKEAFEFCQDTYSLNIDELINIRNPAPGCQSDWIENVRVKGRETGNPIWGQFERLVDGHWTEITSREKIKSFEGMTGNERLFLSGLLNELNQSMIADKTNAEKILRAMKFDELSINQILSK